jgi:YidC/Oxa1 family membrane protein insertase
MQAIQPLINDLREKYKSDPQKMNQKMMELWKEHKVNPAAGCLPMLPQLPVFFALFTVFRYTIEFRNAPFAFWMTDLALPDPYYVLPILMSGTMFLQQKLTVKDPKQKMMIYIFPALFLWWGISFPSGLCLYWTATNLFSLVESVLVHKRHLPTPTIQPEPAKSDAGKPKKHNKKKRQ